MGSVIRCRRRGHKWRVIGWQDSFAGIRPHVHIECSRCGELVTAEVI